MSHSIHRIIAAALFLGASAHASAADYAGRGVFNFASGSGCPLSSLASTSNACNRLALADGDTHAVLDTASQTIRFGNTRNYADSATVGDVLLQGSGLAADGRRVPLSLHMKLGRDDMKWKVSVHAHAPVRGEFNDIKVDPYRVTVNGAEGEETVLTPEQAIAVLAKPSFAARVAREFVQVRSAARHAGDAHVTIALGAGKAATTVASASFESERGAAADIPAQIEAGTWSLELRALSSHIPRKVVQGDLFLFQLENEALLQSLRAKGFDKNDTLVLGAKSGKGYLRFNGVQQDFPGAGKAARLFMEDSFIGLILSWQQRPHVANAN